MQASARNSRSPAVLVLAGRRAGTDSLAEVTRVSHKCLVEVAGEPMICRVLAALAGDPRLGDVTISIDDPEVLERDPRVAEALRAGGVSLHRSRPSPSASTLDFFASQPPGTPVLVTTADHALLRTETVAWFWSRAQRAEADIVAALVSGGRFRARFPDQPRTLIRFSDASFTGANLFALRGPRAAAALRFWVKAEKYRKKPWRLVGMFGTADLLRFVSGRLDLRTALTRASSRIGARVGVVELPFAEAAIDVDKPADLELVARLAEGSRSVPC